MFVVLINASAGWVRQQSLASLVSRCRQTVGDQGRVVVTHHADEVAAVLAGLEVDEITALVPLGGDGTLSAVLIQPSTDGHPVKRVNYATEVNHGKTSEAQECSPCALFGRV